MKSLILAFCLYALTLASAAAGAWFTPQTFTQTVTITGTGPLLVGTTAQLSWGLMSSAYAGGAYITGTAAGCVSMDGWGANHTLVVRSSGLQGAAIVSLSQTGAPGQIVVQQIYYSAPALQVIRDSASGDAAATAPLIEADVSDETPDTVPVAQFKKCGVSGDNGVICYPDGSLTLKSAAAPASPDAGRIWFDPATHHFMGWNGTAAVQLDN